MRFVRWLDLDSDTCSIARTMQVLGDRWTLLVVRDAAIGVSRFDDFVDHLGISPPVLTRRLRALVEAGVLEHQPYRQPGSRARLRYVLTDKGRDLVPVLIALTQWGDRHTAGPEGAPMLLEHRDCGAAAHVAVTCEQGHELLTGRDVVVKPGPGARSRLG